MNKIAVLALVLGVGTEFPSRQPAGAVWEGLDRGALVIDSDDSGVHNVRVFFADESRTVLSGSLPHGEAGFATLASMGVTTLISVDAARPELELAQRHGLRYIHIPVKYSGITGEQRAAMTLALAQSAGTVYVHCHHGRHRGPAAAAIGLIGLGACTPEQGELLMRQAGTSPKYAGLWADVAGAATLGDEELAAAAPMLVEHAAIEGLPAIMAEMDRAFDHLDVLSQNAWEAPAHHPDLSAVSEAGHLSDLFRTVLADETLPTPSEEYARIMGRAAEQASRLERDLVNASAGEARAAFEALGDSCNQCHAVYR
jgi:hypothetical protein